MEATVESPGHASLGVLEAFLGVLLVTGIAAVIPGHWGLLDVQPHPLWLVVIAIAIRYGVPAGYAVGAFAACGYGVLLYFRPGADGTLGPEHELLQVALLFVGGLVAGELVQAEHRRRLRAEEERGQVAASLEEVTQRCQVLQDVKGELEQRIVGQTASVISLYDAAKHLTTLDASAVCEATVNLVVSFVEAEACSLYLEDSSGQLRLEAHVPPLQAFRRSVLDPRQGLVRLALQERRVATLREQVLNGQATAADGRQAVMAGPLLDIAGRPCGVVVIERIPFLKFTPASVQLFGLVVDWASTALQNADAHHQMRAKTIVDETTGVFTPAHTLDLLRQECLRCQRYNLPLSIIVHRVRSFSPDSPTFEPQAELLKRLKLQLRPVDILGQAGESGTFALILPLTDFDGAQRVAARIRSDVYAHLAQNGNDLVSIRIGVAAFSSAHPEPEDMLSRALAAMQDAAPELIVAEAVS